MIVGRSDVLDARARIAGRVRTTPVIDIEIDGQPVTLKLELLQHTGSFKPRGAFNRVLSEPALPAAGLIAASGGNHGAAVAYVGRTVGVPVEVFVPEVTPAIKRHRIEGLGATVVVGGAHYPDALAASRLRQQVTGALEVHAYDHPAVVAGQGTMAAEIADQVPDAEVVLVAAGGGGFIAGTAAFYEGEVEVVGVEPEGSQALTRALEAGTPVPVPIDSIAADSLGASPIGAVPFASIVGRVKATVLVTDDEIRSAQRWLWSNLRLVAEPGGAAALAAVLAGRHRLDGRRLVVAVCGSNTDPATVV
jgi:threonine dehydratase